MDEPTQERFSCSVCGRTGTVVMGDRGPIKVELERQRVGNFLFCVECLAKAIRYTRETVDSIGTMEARVLEMTSGPHAGEKWITSADYLKGASS